MLKLTDVNVFYGYVQALKDVSIEINEGEIITLLGANGAGKSTTLKVISRLVNMKSGEYELFGKSLAKRSPHHIVENKVIHCPENRRVFPELTVEENLRIGSYVRKDEGIQKDFNQVLEYFPRLKERLKQLAGTLSGGEQQMLAMGRALMGDPKILLLDEPSLGLAPTIVREIFDIIQQINKEGISVLLVEQNVNLALDTADYGYILKNGQIQLHGKTEVLQENDEVKKLYLGA